MNFTGTTGDDILVGTDDADRFDLRDGGRDMAFGGRGHDRFLVGATLDTHDRINGGGGNDTLTMNGDYTGANALVCSNATLHKIDTIFLIGGHSYDITLADGNTTAKGGVVNASGLGASDTLHLDLSAETNGDFRVLGSAGDDVIAGGQSDDIFETRTGSDSVSGNAGNDELSFGGPNLLDGSDHFDGGVDFDTLLIAGAYASPIHITPSMLANVEELDLIDPHDYDVTIDDGVVAAGQTMVATTLHFGLTTVNSLTLDASAETNGTYDVTASDGDDTIRGGAGNDTIDGRAGIDDITGGAGADTLTGGSGIDRFHYGAVSESASTTHDTIADFDVVDDFFDLNVTVDGYDGQTTSAIAFNAATLDANLTTASAGHFALAGTARALVIDTGSHGGDLDNHTFLIVDVNGDKAYTANVDYVFDITGAANLGSLAVSNFT